VQDCELFSLPDLNTGLASVRRKIADYLIGLARLGVAGSASTRPSTSSRWSSTASSVW